MANSYRTQKESSVAARRIRRGAGGEIVYPRIVVKPPTPGDVHPLTRSHLRRLFERIPLEYLYGLRRIELRSRLNEEIGKPFGHYGVTGENRINCTLSHPGWLAGPILPVLAPFALL